jgi:hypothetical protein
MSNQAKRFKVDPQEVEKGESAIDERNESAIADESGAEKSCHTESAIESGESAIEKSECGCEPIESAIEPGESAVDDDDPEIDEESDDIESGSEVDAKEDIDYFKAAISSAIMGQIQAQLMKAMNNPPRDENATIENNLQKRRRNFSALNEGNHNWLYPLAKVVDGYGSGLAGYPIEPSSLNAWNLQVGDAIPSPPFPTDIHQISNLTHETLSLISALLNEDFDIIAEDDLPQRIVKFEKFITRI